MRAWNWLQIKVSASLDEVYHEKVRDQPTDTQELVNDLKAVVTTHQEIPLLARYVVIY